MRKQMTLLVFVLIFIGIVSVPLRGLDMRKHCEDSDSTEIKDVSVPLRGLDMRKRRCSRCPE